MKPSTLPYILIVVLLLSACKIVTEPSSTVQWHAPEIGSRFDDHWISTSDWNEADGTHKEGADGTSLLNVTGRGAFQGKSNVVQFNNGLIYLAYEDNGDVSWGKAADYTVSDWDHYPTGGGTILLQQPADYVDQSGERHQVQHTRSNTGTETITFAGRAYSAIRIHDDYTVVHSNPDPYEVFDSTNNQEDKWWVPSIGMWVKSIKTYSYDDNRNGFRRGLYKDSLVTLTIK